MQHTNSFDHCDYSHDHRRHQYKYYCYYHGCNGCRLKKQSLYSARLDDGAKYKSKSQLEPSQMQMQMQMQMQLQTGLHGEMCSLPTKVDLLDVSGNGQQMITTKRIQQIRLRNLFKTKLINIFIISILFSELFSILIQFSAAFASTSQSNNYSVALAQNRNSGQLSMSQLCGTRSHFPITKRIEGTVLSSTHYDVDMNCTILLRTKSSQQHFVIRFEELRLGCDDHLILFESDYDYGQSSIADLSCRDNMANVPIFKTTGTFLTLRYTTDRTSKTDDGFRAIVTAVFDQSISADCPPEYSFCRNHLCISKSLFCDGINHCVDGSDEIICDDLGSRNDLSYALALFIALLLVITICVIVFIGSICCRPESPYAQYQNQIQRAFGVPLQTSSSLMFAANQPQYQFFHQPANLSPFVTPQHHAAALAATLPRGYSTLPLNLARPAMNHQRFTQQALANNKASSNHINEQMNNHDYLMMTTYSGPQTQVTTTNPTVQSNLILPTSQSILPVNTIRYQTQPFNQEPR